MAVRDRFVSNEVMPKGAMPKGVMPNGVMSDMTTFDLVMVNRCPVLSGF